MGKTKRFIFDTFIKLTSKTYPYGTEDSLVKDIILNGLLPNDISKDLYGNYYYKIGSNSRTIFATHLDTVCKEQTDVKHVVNGNIVKTDGKTTLGADDKAGVTVMLWMIRNNIPGLYYFFIGEEVGCIGSGNLAKGSNNFKNNYDRIISFDRRGTNSVITHQSYARCCSDVFAKKLASELNKSGMSYKTDDTGVYTDSAEFVSIIPECTNISVGYYKEHTFEENQDMLHLEKLAIACLNVDWESLPTKRDASLTEYKNTSSHTHYNNGYCYGYDFSESEREFSFGKNKRKNKSKKYYYDEDDYYSSDYDTKSYFTDGDDLVTITNTQNHYIPLFPKVSGKLTNEELEIVKEQYLDMNDYNDVLYYNYLISYINDKSL
jgi:hypothetical protein